ncbi:polysaccharide transporter, PST family [Paenibacillus sophorae]|uniref:Lipopolysaccharide biosynthesis protein n=1 Tax=Paenibacillus sophorae TaxID=1333845 RepID=A0A1H8QH61_9BACL|nr:lipopolysaccharide biosynthesis protein [Paenibacillus sophorae]QWU15123.1 lipopolysaccharide biosynthesis protein [Paenibacillus sophorae]SEO53552.1 polysaccharide transporter, PST family [Paenibacillus sophorae]
MNENEISIKKAATINFIAKYINVVIQILYSAILARILTPADFGIVVVITVFTTFFMLLADMGIGPAVIQNKKINENDTNNIFTFTVYLGIVVAALFMLFSIPLSAFYDNEVYVPIGVLLSISLFFNTLNIVPNALLLKKKQFKTLGVRLIVITIISAIPTIILAQLGFRYYAIVFYSILSSLFTFIWNYITVQLRFKLTFEMHSIIKIRNFSLYQFAFNFVNYFSRNLDNLLIGKFIGNAALGYYDKSYRLMLMPVQNLTHVITPILHPILSNHQEDKAYIFTRYMKVVKILSLLGVFITVYCFFSAEEIIFLMFGDQWGSAVPSFRILALSVWAQMVTSSSGAIFQSLGNTRLMFITGIYTSIISVIAELIGVSFQNITIVAACVAIAFNLHFFIVYHILIKRGFEYRRREFFAKFIPDIVVFIITFMGLHFVSSLINVDNLLLSALFKGVAGGTIYVIGLLLTKQYKVFLFLINRKITKGSR